MQRLDQFRKYYNHTIHPELMRLERRRIRLVRLLFLSLILLGVLLGLVFYLNILAISLVLTIPATLYIIYLGTRIRMFKLMFKPHVMNLILDFIDDGINLGTLIYNEKKFLPKEKFLSSKLFITKAPVYEGEDYIEGKVGQMDFELCELRVRDYSPVRTQLDTIFQGVFLHAIFPEEVTGIVIVWPRKFRQYLTRSIKAFSKRGGRNVDHEIQIEAFRNHFLTYATEETHVAGILSEPMQESIVRYFQKTGKEMYISFLDKEIFIAISEEKDILEPNIFRSNLSFELVREFFEDIQLLLSIVEDFDQTH